MNDLKPCPFCGSNKVTVKKKNVLFGFNGLEERIETHSVYARCNKCFARGGVSTGKIVHDTHFKNFPTPVWATTDEELIERSVTNWNKRA